MPVVNTAKQSRPETPPLAVSVNEACRVLGVSRPILYGAIRTGQLRSVKLGGRRLIPVEALRDLLDPDQS